MKIQLIIGSTRPGRVGPQIARWIVDNLPEHADTEYEIVDLTTIELPIFNEPIHPSMNQYEHDHTKEWSSKVSEAGAFIFLTPEYNAGYPAALKNAIDYLFHEWTNKPVMIVSYGVQGGASASAQLRQVAERLKMRPTEISPAFSIARDMSGEDGQLKDIMTSFEPYVANLRAGAEQLLELTNSVEAAVA